MEQQDLAQIMHRLMAKIDENQETTLAAIKANEETTVRMEANQAKADAARKADKEEMLAELKADRKAYREDQKEMKDAMQAMRSELDETIRQRIQTEVTGKIEKARLELQAVELSLDKQTKKFREDLTNVDVEVKATRKEALVQQRLVNEKIEAEMREFRARLEEVGAVPQQGSIPALGASTIQPPTYIFQEERHRTA
jgi:hypothetical protein